jgi:hypothetical protein
MKNTNIHIIAITTLTLVFFAILFLTTGNGQVDIKYEFKDEIEINFLPTYDTELAIGTITVENTGIFPAKTKLKSYIVCQISDIFGDKSYQLNYRGSSLTNSKDIFYYNYNRKYVEISSNEKITFTITPSINRYDITRYINEYDLNNVSLPFYIFEIKENNDGRLPYSNSYCTGKDKNDAYKVIMVTLNIDEKDLENEKVYY